MHMLTTALPSPHRCASRRGGRSRACICSPRRLPLPPGDSTLLEPYAGALLARQSLQGLGDTEWVVRAATCSTLGLLTGAAWRAVVGALLPMIEDVYASVRARARR